MKGGEKMASKKITKVGIKKEKGYLYFVDKQGKVVLSGHQSLLHNTNIHQLKGLSQQANQILLNQSTQWRLKV